MPPRADFDQGFAAESFVNTAKAKEKVGAPSSPKPKQSSSSSSTSPRRKNCPPRERRRRHPRIIFRSTHGISGVVSTLLTCVAIATQKMPSLPLSSSSSFFAFEFALSSAIEIVFPILAAITSVITASSGIAMVDQAPKQTVVMDYPIRVVPPHRDAFRRTAFSIYYLGARICWNAILDVNGSTSASASDDNTISDWMWGSMALGYAIKYFVPRSRADVDWTNGNTYVFVVPMAVGLTADALFQLPILQCHYHQSSFTTTTTTCWNEDIITQCDLLWVLLSGLVVAFVFTLAFRGVLSTKNCYWGAALVVHAIVAYLIAKALPFVTMQI